MFTTRPRIRARLARLQKTLEQRAEEGRELLRGVAFLRPDRLNEVFTGRRTLDQHTLDLHRAVHPYLHELEVWDPSVHDTGGGAGEEWHEGLVSDRTLEDVRAENAAREAERPYYEALGRRLLAHADADDLAVPAGAVAPGELSAPRRAALMFTTLIALHPDVYAPGLDVYAPGLGGDAPGLGGTPPAAAEGPGLGATAQPLPTEALPTEALLKEALLKEAPLSDGAWVEGASRLMAFVAEHPECMGPVPSRDEGRVSPSDLFRLTELCPAPAAPPPGAVDRFVVDLLYAAPPETARAVFADEGEAWGLLRRVWDDARLRYRVLDLIAAYPPPPPYEFFYTYNGVLYNVLRQIRKRPERFEGVRAVLMRDYLLPSSHGELLLHFEDVIPIREHLIVFHAGRKGTADTGAADTGAAPTGAAAFPVELTF